MMLMITIMTIMPFFMAWVIGVVVADFKFALKFDHILGARNDIPLWSKLNFCWGIFNKFEA